MAANHLYLSKLDDEIANPPTVPLNGHWHGAEEARLLGSIADGIDVSQQSREDVRGVSSVPDVWARPVLFQSALQDAKHPLHDRVVREWRGLLSLLALRKVHNFPVEFVPVPLEGGTFARALETLAPPPVQLEAEQRYAWTDVLMIRWAKDRERKVPFGAFSPSTLVYTATGYQHAMRDEQLSLCDARGFLQPPTDREDLLAVAEWVKRQKEQLDTLLDKRRENPDDRTVHLLGELFNAWLTDLRVQLPGVDLDAAEVKVAEEHHDYAPRAWGPLDRYRVYQTLLRPLVLDEEGGADVWSKSSLFLGTTRNRSEHTALVVLHEGLLDHRAKIWGFKRLSSLGGDAATALRSFDDPQGYGDIIAGERLRPYDAIWIRPERYFLTDTLLRAKDRRFALADKERAPNGEDGRFVLPFRARLFDYFGPDDIEKLRPKFDEFDGGVHFSFSLPLREGGEVRIKKTYRDKNPGAGEGSVRRESLPVLDLFPNHLPGWRRYYLFHSDADRFTAAPIIAEGTLHRSLNDRIVEQPDGTRQKAIVVETFGDDAFPEAVALAVQDGNHTTEVGAIVVRRRIDDSGGLRDRWTVGVDFGTSNTNVYIQREGDPARPLQIDFAEHLRPLTDVDPTARTEQLQTFFVPAGKETFPTPTFLDLLSAKPSEGRLLLDYFIHFPDTPWWPSRVRHNLKWDAQDRVTTYFLESVLFLVLLRATAQRVESLDLRFSYPKTFSEDEINVYTGEWNTAYKALYEDEATAVLTAKGPRVTVDKPRSKSEGKAAGEFFTNERTIEDVNDRATKSRSLCLDVGGGTTDVSLWFNDHIVYDTSVRFAGKQIAGYLSRYPALREILLGPDAVRALSEAGTNEELFGARLNYVLRQEDRDLAARLNRGSNRPELVRLRQLVAFEFGAITFYAAALIGAAEHAGVASGLLAKVAQGGIGLHWGGNAAKLITWIDYGERQRHGLAEKILNGLFYMSLKDIGTKAFQPNLGQIQSPQHKSEAAGGLVVLDNDQLEDERAPTTSYDEYDVEPEVASGAVELTGIVTGEHIVVDGRELGPLETITEKDLYGDGQCLLESVSAERLARFVELFNTFGDKFGLFSGGMAISLDEARKRQIQEKTMDFFVGQKSRKEGTRVIEPPFIVEAKLLMDLAKSSR